MQLDLKKQPFGRRLSRHMIYEETDNLGLGWAKGLCLALSAESGGSMFGGPLLGPKGFIRITPTYLDQPLDYTYTATASVVTLTTEKGIIRFGMDGAKALRIEGKGVGLRLDGKLSFGGNAFTTERGIEILQGGVYLIKAIKGTAVLDCAWDLKALKLTDPIVTIEPGEDGVFDVVAFDSNASYELSEIAESFDQCIAESEADYQSFVEGLTKAGSGYEAFLDHLTYALWMSFLPYKGTQLGCTNKISDQKIFTLEQPVMALPFSDASAVMDLLGGMFRFLTPMGMLPSWFGERQNLYEAAPPLFAYTVSRLLDSGSFQNAPKAQIAVFYDQMSNAVNWWLTARANDKGLSFYAYRHECGYACERIFDCGLPAAAPDLAAYLVLAAESLSRLAELLGKTEETASWIACSARQLDVLTNVLWNKDHFRSVHAITGEACPAEGILALMPLILGARLPGEIIGVLAQKAKDIPFETASIIPASLVILGLRDAGKKESALIAADRLIKSCYSGGANDPRGIGLNAGAFYAPAACAALLALTTLQ
jgi:hypothetical protein